MVPPFWGGGALPGQPASPEIPESGLPESAAPPSRFPASAAGPASAVEPESIARPASFAVPASPLLMVPTQLQATGVAAANDQSTRERAMEQRCHDSKVDARHIHWSSH